MNILRKTAFLGLLMSTVFMCSAIENNRFAPFREYVQKCYFMQGLWNSYSGSNSHDTFLHYLNKDAKFAEFKRALQSRDPQEAFEARQMHETILNDFKECLINEQDNEPGFRSYARNLSAAAALGALVGGRYTSCFQLKKGLYGAGTILLLSAWIFSFETDEDLRVSRPWLKKCSDLLNLDMKYKLSLETFKKRIEAWEQLVPQSKKRVGLATVSAKN